MQPVGTARAYGRPGLVGALLPLPFYAPSLTEDQTAYRPLRRASEMTGIVLCDDRRPGYWGRSPRDRFSQILVSDRAERAERIADDLLEQLKRLALPAPSAPRQVAPPSPS